MCTRVAALDGCAAVCVGTRVHVVRVGVRGMVPTRGTGPGSPLQGPKTGIWEKRRETRKKYKFSENVQILGKCINSQKSH